MYDVVFSRRKHTVFLGGKTRIDRYGYCSGLALFFFRFVVRIYSSVYACFDRSYTNRQRVYVTCWSAFVLITAFVRPTGLIDFDRLEGENIIIAEYEGVANCTTTLKLKKNNKFVLKKICFGTSDVKGTYTQVNDTVFFKDVKYFADEKEWFYDFALIERKEWMLYEKKYLGSVTLYKDRADTLGYALYITDYKVLK